VITLNSRFNDDYIDKIVNNVTATLAIEGCKASGTAVRINRQYLEGKITSKEAVRRIKEKYKKYIGGK
jgi:hypothetical protein